MWNNVKKILIFAIAAVIVSGVLVFIFGVKIKAMEKFDSNILMGIITVSTVLCGFSINNQGMLIGLLDNAILKKSKIELILKKRHEYLILSIFSSSITFVISLISLVSLAFIDEKFIDGISAAIIFCFLMQVISIVFFVLSSKSIFEVVNIILNSRKQIKGDKKEKIMKAYEESGVKKE